MELWQAILVSQMETSLPYIMYKDAVNQKCNQQNIGTIRSSNLCAEITEYSDANEYAVCNLASIALPKFVNPDLPEGYDLAGLADAAGELTVNLNQIIDQGYSPLTQIRRSNLRHRPIGIEVQGLADVSFLLGVAYNSEQGRRLNRLISEAIHFGTVRESIHLAQPKSKFWSPLQNLPVDQRVVLKQMVRQLELQENILTEGRRQNLWSGAVDCANDDSDAADEKEISQLVSDIRSDINTRLAMVGMPVPSHLLYELQYLDLSTDPSHWGTYSSFRGSPASECRLQPDLWVLSVPQRLIGRLFVRTSSNTTCVTVY